MSNFRYFLKRYKNKIGAVSFLGIGLLIYLGFYLGVEILSEWTYFRSDVFAVWNFLITLVCYLYLFVTNIRNDNAAYTGIFMFISLIVLQGVFNIIDIIRMQSSISFGDSVILALFIVYCVALAATVVVGVLFYFHTFRYMTGRNNDFRRIRLFALVFGGVLLITLGVLASFYGLAGFFAVPTSLLLVLAIPISEVFVGIGVIFTLERLRRI